MTFFVFAGVGVWCGQKEAREKMKLLLTLSVAVYAAVYAELVDALLDLMLVASQTTSCTSTSL